MLKDNFWEIEFRKLYLELNIFGIIEETVNGLRKLHIELFVRPSMIINNCNWCYQEVDRFALLRMIRRTWE